MPFLLRLHPPADNQAADGLACRKQNYSPPEKHPGKNYARKSPFSPRKTPYPKRRIRKPRKTPCFSLGSLGKNSFSPRKTSISKTEVGSNWEKSTVKSKGPAPEDGPARCGVNTSSFRFPPSPFITESAANLAPRPRFPRENGNLHFPKPRKVRYSPDFEEGNHSPKREKSLKSLLFSNRIRFIITAGPAGF
jgi:hypothetical protein